MTDPTAKLLPCPLSDEQVKHMVDRFLAWRLPENFSPDGGISFKPTFNDHLPTPTKHEPSGTNLFDYDQAEAMVRYMTQGLPENTCPQPAPTQDEPDWLAIARDIENCAFDHSWPAEISHEDYIKGIADWLKNRLGAASHPKVEDADLLNDVTDLIDEEVFGDAANRDKAERIIDLVLTTKLASPDREIIRKMIGDLRWQGSTLCMNAADLLERFAARLKVKDAEVAKEISLIDGFLAGTHGTDKPSFRLYMRRWRDLLERLASALAEREAELATLRDGK